MGLTDGEPENLLFLPREPFRLPLAALDYSHMNP
jgi:hypothetical protein